MTDFINDPYWGKGGRYVVDPETGKRMPAPPEPIESVAANETAEAPVAEAPTPAPATESANVQPIRKGK